MPAVPSVAFVTLATHRYIAFVEPLLTSCRQHFLTDCAVTPIVLTDRTEAITVEAHAIEHRPWPYVTLNKFGTLARFRARLDRFDYVFMCDVDTRFVADVGREILGDLVAVRHPSFHDRPENEFTYERRPESRACMPPGSGKRYYVGSFTGGNSATFLDACATIQAAVDDDTSRGITACWHDESHWNHFLFNCPPTVELSPSYCYPEGSSLPFEPRLLALEKDHVAVRFGPWRGWLARFIRLAKRFARPIRAALRRTGGAGR